MKDDLMFSPEVIEDAMKKEKVMPLVVIENGERRIVGTAKLIPSGDGMGISARITDRKVARDWRKIEDALDLGISINQGEA